MRGQTPSGDVAGVVGRKRQGEEERSVCAGQKEAKTGLNCAETSPQATASTKIAQRRISVGNISFAPDVCNQTEKS